MTHITTLTGHHFDLLHPAPAAIDIVEIAHALSHLCRFTGHVDTFYRVAQHSVLVSHLVPEEHALAGLLHDATEAYLGDVAAPLKRLLPDYQAIERNVERAVLARFGLAPVLPACIKQADLSMLAAEAQQLMGTTHLAEELRGIGLWPAMITINPLSPLEARQLFMERFVLLTSRRAKEQAA